MYIRLDPLLCVQGAFLDSEAVNKSSSNLSADELLELLNTDKTFQDKAQSGVVSDKVFVLSIHQSLCLLMALLVFTSFCIHTCP